MEAFTQKASLGFTLIQELTHTGESSAAEFQIVASTQTNLNIKFGVHDRSTTKWAMVVTGIA